MGFGCESTGDETIFVRDAICSNVTHCISAVGIETLDTLNGVPAFSEMTCWIGGDGIETSVTLYGQPTFSEMMC